MLRRDLFAVFIFRRVIGDGTVQAANLQAYVSPAGSDRDPLSRQGLTLLLAPSHAQRTRFHEDDLSKSRRIFRFRHSFIRQLGNVAEPFKIVASLDKRTEAGEARDLAFHEIARFVRGHKLIPGIWLEVFN